ncbi:MAG TPA: nitronate monooxygenase [Oligoflexus sp.]|uniref:NAD(P)H-dependent flavin oxidoreductase n=1 Tax=Oligoflexus sp. TaxID=1971216 RepID=UPI002D24E8FF|nr:nitronate monooxygenase [Oligoflexus sp.]HYX32561.1 nitronate monooxygenase [Oligoflexus sp.]
MSSAQQLFTEMLGIKHPIIGGAMYPCSNPELVAAVSAAGGIGVVQPISLTYVHKHGFREGLRYIRTLTPNPIGLNLLIEKSSQKYLEKNQQWLDIALEEGVRFFITALGNPSWVVKRVEGTGAKIFHDVTAKSWAQKAMDAGVHGLICVNNRAGGHAGNHPPDKLFQDLKEFGVPLICAGGIGDGGQYRKALSQGYQGVQLGTRFIASKECTAHADYKQAILSAKEEDIILTKKISGVPVAVINTDYMKNRGSQVSGLENFLLNHARTKHYARMFYSLRSVWQLKQSLQQGAGYKEFFQAGKSVSGIHEIQAVAQIIENLVAEGAAGART